MDFRSDGRKYARITRKSAELIALLDGGSTYELEDVSSLIAEQHLQEFYLVHLGKFISPDRVRDYLRFLVRLEILSETDGKFAIELDPKPATDPHKVQVLADRARKFLADLLNVQLASVAKTLESRALAILRKGQLPTLDQIAGTAEISSNREEELFRWAVYVLLDEPNTTLVLRYSPVLVGMGNKGNSQ